MFSFFVKDKKETRSGNLLNQDNYSSKLVLPPLVEDNTETQPGYSLNQEINSRKLDLSSFVKDNEETQSWNLFKEIDIPFKEIDVLCQG